MPYRVYTVAEHERVSEPDWSYNRNSKTMVLFTNKDVKQVMVNSKLFVPGAAEFQI